MSDLTFEELTGTSSVEEWTEQSSNEELASISGLAQQLLVVQKDIEEKKLELKELENQFRQISESSLPEALQSANLSEIVLSDGTKLSVSPFYKGHISEKNRPAALDWLMQNGHGGLIKNEISLKFG